MIVLGFSIKAGFQACAIITSHVRDVRWEQDRFNRKLDHISKDKGVEALGKMTLEQIEDYKPRF
jgi:hypothetical protein